MIIVLPFLIPCLCTLALPLLTGASALLGVGFPGQWTMGRVEGTDVDQGMQLESTPVEVGVGAAGEK